MTLQWPSWKNSVILINEVVVFLINVFVSIVVVVVNVVILDVFVAIIVCNYNCNCNHNCNLLSFFLLSEFDAIEPFGFTLSGMRLLLVSSHFHFWKESAFSSLYWRFIRIRKKKEKKPKKLPLIRLNDNRWM